MGLVECEGRECGLEGPGVGQEISRGNSLGTFYLLASLLYPSNSMMQSTPVKQIDATQSGTLSRANESEGILVRNRTL
jgi:hypothetical protein